MCINSLIFLSALVLLCRAVFAYQTRFSASCVMKLGRMFQVLKVIKTRLGKSSDHIITNLFINGGLCVGALWCHQESIDLYEKRFHISYFISQTSNMLPEST